MRSDYIRKTVYLVMIAAVTHLVTSKLVKKNSYARQDVGSTLPAKVQATSRLVNGPVPPPKKGKSNTKMLNSHTLRIVEFSIDGNVIHLKAEAKVAFDLGTDSFVFCLAAYEDSSLKKILWKDTYPDTVFRTPVGGGNICHFDKFIPLPLNPGDYPLILSLQTVPRKAGLVGLVDNEVFKNNTLSYVGKFITIR